MVRTQISLTEEGRALLDREALKTGRSISALIRDAVQLQYGETTSLAANLAALSEAAGSWADHEQDGESWVEELRPGHRLSVFE